jgi:4-hydroxybenzoate polyprenyltransferase
MFQRLQWTWLRHRRWIPIAASVAMFLAHFLQSRLLRTSVLWLSCVVFVLVVRDLAQQFLDRSYSRRDGASKRIPVTPAQILLAAMLAVVYSFLVAAGLNLFFLPSRLTVFVMFPAIFLICGFVAWHNVTLWYEQGAEYEEDLNQLEQEEQQRIVARS